MPKLFRRAPDINKLLGELKILQSRLKYQEMSFERAAAEVREEAKKYLQQGRRSVAAEAVRNMLMKRAMADTMAKARILVGRYADLINVTKGTAKISHTLRTLREAMDVVREAIGSGEALQHIQRLNSLLEESMAEVGAVAEASGEIPINAEAVEREIAKLVSEIAASKASALPSTSDVEKELENLEKETSKPT